jgi:single-strand DNA-binding protein
MTRASQHGGQHAGQQQGDAVADPLEPRNEVHLVGRVSGPPEERELPSGDALVLWRVVVDRPPPRRPMPEGVRLATIDTLDCVAWSAGTRRTARGLGPGDVVAVSGALRRRFFRAGAAASSRTEVEVSAVRRLARGSG